MSVKSPTMNASLSRHFRPRILQTQDTSDPRYFSTGAELSVRHFGTSAEHIGTSAERYNINTYLCIIAIYANLPIINQREHAGLLVMVR